MPQIKLCLLILVLKSCSNSAAADSIVTADGVPTLQDSLAPPQPDSFRDFNDPSVTRVARETDHKTENVAAPPTYLVPPAEGQARDFRSYNLEEKAPELSETLVPPLQDEPQIFREKKDVGTVVSVPQPPKNLTPPNHDEPQTFNQDQKDHVVHEDALITDQLHDEHDHIHHEDDGHDHMEHEYALMDHSNRTSLANLTLHDEINAALAEDEERVLAGGEVKIRKKRTFCKKCFPIIKYGYGGGGGCCGACGQCGRRVVYVKPAPVRYVAVPVSSGCGGCGCGGCGCGGCRPRPRPACGVCGR